MRVSPAATFLVPIEAEEVHRHRRRGGLVAALAAAAAVTILVPMWWDYPGPRAVPPAQTLAGRDGHDRGRERCSVERACGSTGAAA